MAQTSTTFNKSKQKMPVQPDLSSNITNPNTGGKLPVNIGKVTQTPTTAPQSPNVQLSKTNIDPNTGLGRPLMGTVTFDKKGGYTANVGGKDFTLNAAEANAYENVQGFSTPNQPIQITDNVKALLQAEAAQRQTIQNPQTQTPFVPPQPLSPDTNAPSVSALGIGKIASAGAGGAAAGAGIGAAIAGIPTLGIGAPIGAAIGGVIGGLGGAGTAFFLGQSSTQKQYTRATYADFTVATKNIQKIMNNANGKQGSPMANRAYMDNELARVYQSQRELKAQSKKLFGKELSNNQDELAKIDGWLQNWDRYGDIEFQMALDTPNPGMIDTSLAMANEGDTTQ